MPETATPAEPLLPVVREDLLRMLGYALRFGTDGKAHNHARELTAQIAAETLVRHFEQAGFIVMRRPGPKAHGTP
jgi:hypothetical protein